MGAPYVEPDLVESYCQQPGIYLHTLCIMFLVQQFLSIPTSCKLVNVWGGGVCTSYSTLATALNPALPLTSKFSVSCVESSTSAEAPNSDLVSYERCQMQAVRCS